MSTKNKASDREIRFGVPDGFEADMVKVAAIKKMSDLACHFTAGILNHAVALTAIICPTYNCYQGLLAQGDLADFS